MKARFDKRQNKVTVKQLNGKDYIFLCLNGKTVKETPEGQDEPQTFYEYDYTEITAETGAVDLDDVKKNPDQYATYEPEREKKPEEKIAELEEKENIPLENVLIVVDDLALPFGTLRLKGNGSDAGHNGLKHIASTLGTQNYARLRFGIGNDFPRGGQIDYVLGHFTDEDWKTMEERLATAGEIIKSFCLAGIDITMNQFNKK